MHERGRNPILKFLVDINVVARFYKRWLPGITDLMALELAKQRGQVDAAPEVTQQVQAQKQPAPPAVELAIKLSARQKYGDVHHAKRYGDYGAAREIEKENRRNFMRNMNED